MGKPTGFIEYLRELPLDRAAIERIKDWNEFHFHMDEKKLREQGARCIDCGWEEGWVEPEPPAVRTGKKVAVIGSGPAGLCAAAQLNKVGHSVTVFERPDRVGGLLMYGIPNMKLDKDKVVMRRIKVLEQEGIKFVCCCEVGKTLPARQLLDEFDAVVLCTG